MTALRGILPDDGPDVDPDDPWWKRLLDRLRVGEWLDRVLGGR